MERLIKCIIFALIMTVFGCKTSDPCYDKDTFVNSFEAFIDSLENKNQESLEEWKINDERFNAFMDKCFDKYKSDLSSKEKLELGKKTVKYYYYRMRQAIKNGEDFDDVKLHRIEDDVLQAFKDVESEAKLFFDENFKDDFKGIMDDIISDVKDLDSLWNKKMEEYENRN